MGIDEDDPSDPRWKPAYREWLIRQRERASQPPAAPARRPTDLEAIVALWHRLPEPVRAEFMATVGLVDAPPGFPR